MASAFAGCLGVSWPKSPACFLLEEPSMGPALQKDRRRHGLAVRGS